LITAVFAAFLAAMVVGTTTAFLLEVPAVSVLTLIVILLGMFTMFALGLHAGGRRIRLRKRAGEWSLPLTRRLDRLHFRL
jgi:hypothetical protein